MNIKKRNVANYKHIKLFAAAVLVGELSGDTDGLIELRRCWLES